MKIINDVKGMETVEMRQQISELKGSKAQRKHMNEAPQLIGWLLTKSEGLEADKKKYRVHPYGNLVGFNTCRVLVDTIGEDVLSHIVSNYLDLLDTSAAVFENNGDYALDIFTSDWCQLLNQASRNLCGTDDHGKALASGTATSRAGPKPRKFPLKQANRLTSNVVVAYVSTLFQFGSEGK